MEKHHALLITPKTRVSELLDVYPSLEPVLMDLAPAFKKLQNPVLRRTVGKVATLQQAAALGKLSLSEIINTLRMEVGQALFDETGIPSEINEKAPGWFDEKKTKVRFDATPMINAGQNPMQEVFIKLDKIKQDEIFMLITPFIPAPIIELIGKKGYAHYCVNMGDEVCHTYFYRNQT
jgi:hypothetical protein